MCGGLSCAVVGCHGNVIPLNTAILQRRHGESFSRLRLQPPVSEARTPPRPVDPSAPPWLLAPSFPPWPGSPLAPLGSLVPLAPSWSGVDHPAPRDSTPLASSCPFVPSSLRLLQAPSSPWLLLSHLSLWLHCGLPDPRLGCRQYLLCLGPLDPPRRSSVIPSPPRAPPPPALPLQGQPPWISSHSSSRLLLLRPPPFSFLASPFFIASPDSICTLFLLLRLLRRRTRLPRGGSIVTPLDCFVVFLPHVFHDSVTPKTD